MKDEGVQTTHRSTGAAGAGTADGAAALASGRATRSSDDMGARAGERGAGAPLVHARTRVPWGGGRLYPRPQPPTWCTPGASAGVHKHTCWLLCHRATHSSSLCIQYQSGALGAGRGWGRVG
ncbi:hypothetical protein EON68_02885 [archaeon]|nr:MAG: hypothetical protein EON68_02885 [archaeon]